MNLFPIASLESIADRRYRSRILSKAPLSKTDCARRWGVSLRHVDRLEADGLVEFVYPANRCRCSWDESEQFMPGGSAEWMSTREAASALGVTPRQLELMRTRSVGPEWRMFGKKLLRYRRASVAAYNQAASQQKNHELSKE